jgi:hypothetical protein
MCAADGCPVAVEVFEGNTADPLTLSAKDRRVIAYCGGGISAAFSNNLSDQNL